MSASDVSRTTFAVHPWCIGGGGASELKENLDDNCERTLTNLNCDVGYLVITGEDNCLVIEEENARRNGLFIILSP